VICCLALVSAVWFFADVADVATFRGAYRSATGGTPSVNAGTAAEQAYLGGKGAATGCPVSSLAPTPSADALEAHVLRLLGPSAGDSGGGAGRLGGADRADAAPMRLSALELLALLKLLGTPVKRGKDPTTGLARSDIKALYLCLVGFGAALPAVTMVDKKEMLALHVSLTRWAKESQRVHELLRLAAVRAQSKGPAAINAAAANRKTHTDGLELLMASEVVANHLSEKLFPGVGERPVEEARD
jgi:hypothetical protein